MNKLRIDIWSDIACPWCHVGKRRLETALVRFAHRDDVDVHWHAFELDPSAPRELDRTVSYAERLAKKYGSTVSQAEAQIAQMTATAAQDGLDFRFDHIRPGNTFDAHRVLHFAEARGVQDAVKERFLRAYLSEGEPIGDPETLIRLASEVGLDAEEVRALLASDAMAAEVRADEADAAALGIHGVPFFVIDRRYAISGAQTAELMLGALTQAWRKLAVPVRIVAPSAPAEVCGPEGCTVPER